MFFYEVRGVPVNAIPKDMDGSNERQTWISEIQARCEAFNEERNNYPYYFVATAREGRMIVGVITETPDGWNERLTEFLDAVDCPMNNLVAREVTINQMRRTLSLANRNDFLEDDDAVANRIGILRIYSGRLHFGEQILSVSRRESIEATAKKYMFGDTILPELERIYAGAAVVKPVGHPVHYMVQTDDPDCRRIVYTALLQALYVNKRLRGRRYAYLNAFPDRELPAPSLEALYRVNAGGAVVIRYSGEDTAEEDGYAGNEQDTIELLCQTALRYRNQVLTVFCLPQECNRVKKLFFENLGSMTFVELKEDVIDGQRAVERLKMLAKDCQIRTDKRLFAQLEPNCTYAAAELQNMFDRWYDRKIKTTIYPQYKDMTSACREITKASPKGSAYEELDNMVGLTDAKAVIRKALNYYKMQKLYEQRGIKQDNPAMHMVFTGNPGTAKTTAARLFARIMKDNGLLAGGQLVEVGRGDLVGKYVGWTAQTVKAKFKAAIGGVLFIDEAYSLVDDRSGSFGDEAINTIVQEMENHREDVVVIFAGYPNEMENFLQKNPGLRSRIAFHVPFADYNVEELCQIAQLMGKSKGVSLDQGALEKLHEVFEQARQNADFGNGRYVRNVLEQAKMNQATRLLEYDFDDITTEEIRTIKAVDITVKAIKKEEKRTIGFAC